MTSIAKIAAIAVVSFAMTSAAFADTTTATVKAINEEDGKVTLKHGPMPELGMPAMTMVFSIDAAKLKGLKVGATVRITVVDQNGRLVLTSIGN